jgi:DNA-binding winged helix-turn-helix (wHTH) protein/predicted ATPase
LRYCFEGYTIDPERRELRRGAALLAIEPQVFDLLEYLIRNRERVVSRDDLMESIWGGRIVSESALSTRINAARCVIGDSGKDQRLIRTSPRKGIRFVGAVREDNKPAAGAVTIVEAIVEAPAPEPAAPVRDSPPMAEWRPLTVVSCELLIEAGTTRMDPESLHDVLSAWHERVTETAARCNGLVGYSLGRTVLVYFGYPVAHEDDAEQAVRAGLELCAAARSLEPTRNIRLQARLGIATGPVIAGDLAGSATRDRAPVGEAPSTASRLQSAARPDTVLIDAATRRLIGSLFECCNIDPINEPDIAETLPAWQVLGASVVESRFEALHPVALTPLVGREEEIELLVRRWSRAKASEGQVVLLAGEAGIGKSRLTDVLLERLATEPHTRLRYFCSPQGTNSALHPIIGQMERATAMAREDTPQAKLNKLDALLALTSTSIEDAALFAEMLSLPHDQRYPALDLIPPQRRQKTLEALVSQVAALSRQNPVLIIFEDAHWSDPTTLEAFGRTVDRIASLRVLLIVTFRPEFEPPWIGQPHVTALTINRLAERDVDAMIDRVVGNKLIPASIRQDIIERTDGIPLFVEEMTKAVLEAEGEDAAKHTVAAAPSPALAVPASLQASLMARLDRLGSAKEVAQVGAAIGREFSYALLAAVVGKPEAELVPALDRLVQSGLLFRQGVPPHATYLFKHALVQDAAYGTLLREPRRALHGHIAELLESQFAEIAESQPELLARHCSEAGLTEKAAGFWGKAGQRSLARSALIEAAEQLTRALNQIAALPATPALRREQIKLQAALINPVMHVKGFAAPETKAAVEQARLLIERAEALGETPEDPLVLFSVLYGFLATNVVAIDGDVACEAAAQFLALAEKQRASGPLMVGHRLMGISLLLAGGIAESRVHLDHAIALYDPAEHRPLAMRFGQDVRVAALSMRSLVLWMLGYPDAALADTDHALKDTREIGHAATLMYALAVTSLTLIHGRNYATVNAQSEELVTLADEKGSLWWKAIGMMHQGCILALTGKASDAVQLINAETAAFRSTGATLWMPIYLSHLAIAYAELSKFDDAWRCIGEAIAAVETTKEKWCEADIHRIAGEIALKSPEPDAAQAEAYFERALAVARGQQAKSWELRAAMSMARLWRDRGKRDAARDLLAPVYGWFTEGFDTLDLKEAKALLDELHA